VKSLYKSNGPRFVEICHGKHLKNRNFMIWGFLAKSLHHRIHPKWFLETSAPSKLILGGDWMLPKKIIYLIQHKLIPWNALGSEGSPPMGSLGVPRVRSYGISWVPKGQGVPPMGLLGSQGSRPMGCLRLPRVPSLRLPRVPSHGIPWGHLGPLPWDPPPRKN
jgi:hypothetical protein